MSKPHVFVGIPSTEKWDALFGMSLAAMTNWSAWNIGFTVHNKRGSILPMIREQLVEEALEKKATHVLFLDSDQTFPNSTMERLVSLGKPIIACNISVKDNTFTPTARVNGKVFFKKKGISAVDYVGMGIMCIETRVFKEMKKPWFKIVYDDGVWIGEDWNFCKKAKSLGYAIYVDNELSMHVGHVGNRVYSLEQYALSLEHNVQSGEEKCL